MNCKTKDVHGRGPSKVNLGLFVCSFDVYQVSLPFSSINYDHSNSVSGLRASSWYDHGFDLLFFSFFFCGGGGGGQKKFIIFLFFYKLLLVGLF